MSYLIFRGVSTESLANVYINRMPGHRKAAMRYTEYYVKGRDGALHVDEGLSSFDLTAVLILLDGTAATRQTVNAWADGTGKLITSDEPGLAYNATVKKEIKWNRALGAVKNGVPHFYDTAEITFTCEPYMVEAVDTSLTLTESGSIVNPGSATALPFITVYGSGDTTFTINGTTITINAMTAGIPVNIDTANGYVYTEAGATSMVGEFPDLGFGENQIVFGAGVQQITIVPHWRWI